MSRLKALNNICIIGQTTARVALNGLVSQRFIHTGFPLFTHPPVTYEEIAELSNAPYKLLIDVRRPEDFKDLGSIPGAINIPFKDISKVFSDEMNAVEFGRKYSLCKPKKDQHLIFTCTEGKQAKAAMEKLEKMGYTRARYYLGSYYDWIERQEFEARETPKEE